MQQTFEEIWNRVLLFAPSAPVPLVRTFVQNTYNKIQTYHLWSELRHDIELYIPAAISTGTIAVTKDSNQIVGTGTGWTSGVVGLQIAPGHLYPWFTITAVNTLTQTLTLDRAWEDASNPSMNYEIGKYYVEFPFNLNVIAAVRNSANTWVITPHYRNQDYINRIDARRTSSGTPVVVVAAPPRWDSVNNISIPRYEFWPRFTGETSAVIQCYEYGALSAKTDRPVDMVLPETLLYGALSELAMWPGTSEEKNPYFSIEIFETHKKAYEAALHDSEMRDLNRDQRMIDYGQTGLRYPIDAKFFQNHPF